MSDIKITVEERAGRRCASSGSKWEPIMGYSRAVRSGNIIAVTGSALNVSGTLSRVMRALGATQVLHKPVLAADLMVAVRGALEAKSAPLRHLSSVNQTA